MTTWFAQKGSCNIDSVSGGTTSDLWNDAAVGGGNWMNTSVLTAGGSTTVLVANGNSAIAINIDVNIGTGTITNAATGGTAGGQFTTTTAAANRTITANITGQDTGTATTNGCLSATLHATNRLTITGSVTGGAVAAARGMTLTTTNGLLTVTGTVTGGGNATAYGAYSSTGVKVTLAVLTGATGNAVYLGNAASEVSVSGAISSPAGTVSAIFISGTLKMLAGSSIVSNSTDWTFPISGTPPKIQWETTDTGIAVTLYDAAAGAHVLKVPEYPAVGTVADGTQYDYTPDKGTRIDCPIADARLKADVYYGNPSALVNGLIQMPNDSSPTGTEDATSDTYVVSGMKYGSTPRTGSAAGGGGGGRKLLGALRGT